MTTLPHPAAGRTYETLALHALTWLAAACAVGLLMALLLLVPEAGAMLGPLTFGRWAPLHLDLALYGWCGLPLVGLLLRLYRGADDASRGAALAIEAWSGSLLAGALAWLLGETSGKIFLDWTGAARWMFVAAILGLALVLADGLRRAPAAHAPRLRTAKAALLVALLAVPIAMAVATSRRTYPPINPSSGGPTGADLLGSTVAVLWIFLLTPTILGLVRRDQARATRRLILLLLAQTALFLALGHGDASHRDPLQVAALATLALWVVPLPRYLSGFDWPPGARRWLAAFLLWGAALLATGLLAFLPGVLERVKFTNVLVGHAHVAMAGMATSFAALVLAVLNRGNGIARALGARRPFALWHAGSVLHVAAVLAVGALEAVDPGVLFRPVPAIGALYALRALAGLAMLAAAVTWLRTAGAQEAA